MSKPQNTGNLLRRYPLALACAGVACVLVAVLILRQGALAESRASLEQLETEGKTVERNVRNAVGLEEHLTTLKQGLARIEGMLTRADDISGNQEYFYQLESASGVRVSVLRPLGAPKTVVPGAAYQPAGFNVVVEGEYPQLCKFLRILEGGQRLYRLTDFTVQRASEVAVVEGRMQKEVLTINLQLLAAK